MSGFGGGYASAPSGGGGAQVGWHEFVAQSSNPGSVATDTLYQDDGSNFDAGSLVWSNKFVAQPTLVASSGVEAAVSITPTINQSGTAGYRGLEIDVTETGLGSGNARLISAGVGGTPLFEVDNNGTAIARVDGSTGETFIRGTPGSGYGIGYNGNLTLVHNGSVLGTVSNSAGSGVLTMAGGGSQLRLNGANESIRRNGAGMDFYTGGSARMNIANGGLDVLVGGTAAAPSLEMNTGGVGLYVPAANQLGLAANSESVIVDNDAATPSFRPDADDVWTLGEASIRWANLFAVTTTVGDINLQSLHDNGSWTLNESRDGIFAHDRCTGKKYRVMLEEVDDAPEPLPLRRVG